MIETPVKDADPRRKVYDALETRIEAEQSLRATREARQDSQRRLDALRRAQRSLLSHAEERIQDSRELLDGTCVIVHRSSWMRERLASSLRSEGLRVVGQAENGADGLGITLAEHADLVLVEDLLPSMTGAELARLLQELAPETMVAAQVDGDASVATLLDAGAAAVFTRQVPAPTLVHEVVAQLRQRVRLLPEP